MSRVRACYILRHSRSSNAMANMQLTRQSATGTTDRAKGGGEPLTNLQRPPQPGRPTVSLRQAARLLRRDPRTVQRMVRDGELEGGSVSAKQRTRWYVYSDQLSPTGQLRSERSSPSDSTPSSEISQLRAEVAAAKAQAAEAVESNRLILASQAMLLTALSQYRNAGDEISAISDDYRAIIDRHAEAAHRYRDSADSFASILETYRDVISQFFTPNDASTLTEP